MPLAAYIGDVNFADPNQDMMNLSGAYSFNASFLASSTRAINGINNTSDRDDEAVLLGLRPAVIPEPGTMSLMSLSTLGLFATRSIRRRRHLGQSLFPVRSEHLCDAFDGVTEYKAHENAENVDALSVMIVVLRDGTLQLWSGLGHLYRSCDKAFWNWMVAVHERRVARQIRRRKAVRKKAIETFDAVLSLIMK